MLTLVVIGLSRIFIAAENMSILNVLKSIRKFGLTPSASSELLSVLDENIDEPFSVEVFDEYHKSAQFIRAHRLRGAIGGEQFETKILSKMSEQKFAKKATKTRAIGITLDPPPFPMKKGCFSKEKFDPLSVSHLLSVSEAFEIVTESLKHNEECTDIRWPDVINLCANDIKFARRLCLLFRNDIKLLSNEAVASTLLVAMGHLKKNNFILCEDLHWLHANTQNELGVPQSIKNILSTYSFGSTKVFEKINMWGYSAMDILKSLSNDDGQVSDQNHLINGYLTLVPQIIPSLSSDAYGNYDAKSVQILQHLLLKPSVPLKYLVSLISTRCESVTISKVIKYLLEKHRSELCGSLVFQLFMENFRLVQDVLKNSESCDVFNEYLIDILAKDLSHIASINDFILDLNETVLHSVFQSIANAYRSEISYKRRELIKTFICKLNEEFPDMAIDNGELVVKSLIRISILETKITYLITDLFSSAGRGSTHLKPKMDSLLQFAFSRPNIVMRQIPMLSSLLVSLESVSSRLIYTRYKDVLSLLAKITLHLLDKGTDADKLVPILKSLLCIIEANCQRCELSSIELLFANCCIRYAKGSTNSMKLFFAPNKLILKSLFEFTDSPSGDAVLEILNLSVFSNIEI